MKCSTDLSIILPAMRMNDDLIRCIYSIKSALNGIILHEIIIITPDVVSFSNITGFENINVYGEDMPGIYQAMNTGIKKARGRYLYFMGQDDILLPAAANAILLGKNNQADLILADVYWGKNRIFKNIISRISLAWTNWCHQGIFYNRLRFKKEIGEYPVHFQTQADHYVNIVFSSTPFLKIIRYNACVAWYSAEGFSSRSPDLVFRAVFPNIVRNHIGFFSYCIVIVRRALLKLWRLCL